MPEPNENLKQNCTIRIHLIIDSARQKIKNKETGWYSNSSYQASRVLTCTWTAAIILGSPLPSAAKCTTSHQPQGARWKATMEKHLFFQPQFLTQGGEGAEVQSQHEEGSLPLHFFLTSCLICLEDTRLFQWFPTWKFWACPKYHSCECPLFLHFFKNNKDRVPFIRKLAQTS